MKNQNFKRGHRPQLSRHLVYIHQMPTTGSKASKTENEDRYNRAPRGARRQKQGVRHTYSVRISAF